MDTMGVISQAFSMEKRKKGYGVTWKNNWLRSKKGIPIEVLMHYV